MANESSLNWILMTHKIAVHVDLHNCSQRLVVSVIGFWQFEDSRGWYVKADGSDVQITMARTSFTHRPNAARSWQKDAIVLTWLIRTEAAIAEQLLLGSMKLTSYRWQPENPYIFPSTSKTSIYACQLAVIFM